MAALNLSFFTLGGAVGNAVWGYLYTFFGGIFYVYLLGAMVLFVNSKYFEMHQVTLFIAINYCYHIQHKHVASSI